MILVENRVSPRRPFSSLRRGSLRLDESVLELEISNIPLAVLGQVPSQGVLPSTEVAPTREAHRSLPGDPDMSPALPLSSKTFVTYTATPLPTDVVVHGSGFTTARFGGG